jgi:hypothetical protein
VKCEEWSPEAVVDTVGVAAYVTCPLCGHRMSDEEHGAALLKLDNPVPPEEVTFEAQELATADDSVACLCRVTVGDQEPVQVTVRASGTAAAAWGANFCGHGAREALHLALRSRGTDGQEHPLRDGWALEVATYDGTGRVVRAVDADGNEVCAFRDLLSTPTDPDLRGQPCPEDGCGAPLRRAADNRGWTCAIGHVWGEGAVDFHGGLTGSPGVKLRRRG